MEIERISAESTDLEADSSIYIHLLSNTPIPIKCGAKNQPGEPVALADINVSPVALPPDAAAGSDKFSTLLYKRQGKIVAISRSGKYNVTVLYKALVYRGYVIFSKILYWWIIYLYCSKSKNSKVLKIFNSKCSTIKKTTHFFYKVTRE